MASNSNVFRIWLGLIIGLLAVILLIWSAPKHANLPKGTILPAKNTLPATEATHINFYARIPDGARKLGTINIEQHALKPSQQDVQEIEALAKKLAATVGANGIAVKAFYFLPPGMVPKQLAIYKFTGTAFYTPTQALPSPLTSVRGRQS